MTERCGRDGPSLGGLMRAQLAAVFALESSELDWCVVQAVLLQEISPRVIPDFRHNINTWEVDASTLPYWYSIGSIICRLYIGSGTCITDLVLRVTFATGIG